MGCVYRALDRDRGEHVALKVFPGIRAQKARRTVREAEVLAELSHPGIVRYIAHGGTGQDAYLAMEWLDGEDLDERLTRGPLTASEAVGLIRRSAAALAAAHARAIIHRDLKPSNLFLVGGALDHIKIVDFGIARIGAIGSITRTGAVIGTPGYIAPEQARGDRVIDARADIFSLGCVLFACLTGRAPFVGEDFVAVLAKVLLADTPRVSDLWPAVPRPLDDLVAKMLAPEPDARPESAIELIRMLDALPDLGEVRRKTTEGPSPSGIGGTGRRLLSLIMVEGDEQEHAGFLLDLSSGLSSVGAETVIVDGETVAVTATMEGSSPSPNTLLSEIAVAHRGRPMALAGKSLVVTFGGGGVATDLASLAARCALALRGHVGDRRIALATGPSVLLGGGGPSTLEGDVIDRVARLLAWAPRDEPAAATSIPIDETTAGLLGERFEVERRNGAPRLAGERTTLDDARRVLGKLVPFVGRDREIATLEALAAECFDEPVARVAILTGLAGAGKSRLRRELMARLTALRGAFEVWSARGDVLYAGSSLRLAADAIRSSAGVTGAEPVEERWAKVKARVARHVPEADVARVAAFIGELTGAASPEARVDLGSARTDAVLMADQIRRAFEDLVSAETSAGPLAIVLEDLHWGDKPTTELINGVIAREAGRPLLVIATARPEVHDLFPGLWEQHNPVEVRVGALTPKASERLARHVLGKDAPADLVARLVERAAGLPLLLEEMIRAVAEGGGEELPETALAMIHARLDALPHGARRTLRAASTFGRSFWMSGVAALLGGAVPASEATIEEVKTELAELTRREWIERRAMTRFFGEEEYAFRRDAAREAAYAMLTEEDRAIAHNLAGSWLRAAGERDSLLLARHFELGGDAASAIEAYERAAEQALESNDFPAAIGRTQRAEALGAEDDVRARLSVIASEAHMHRGELELANARATDALASLDEDDAHALRAAATAAQSRGKLGDLDGLMQIASTLLYADPNVAPAAFATACSQAVVQLMLGGRPAAADEVFGKLHAFATESTEPTVVAQAQRAAAIRATFRGDLGATLAHLRTSVHAFEAAGDLRNACSLKKTLGWFAGECGALEEGERALREAIAVASRFGLVALAAHAKHDLGSPLVRLGKLDEAAALQEEAIASFEAQGDKRLLTSACGYLSWVRMLQGRLSEADSLARRAIDLSPSAPLKLVSYVYLGSSRLAAGLTDDALAAARAGLDELARAGGAEEGVTALHLLHAEALHALGRTDEARAAVIEAKREVLAKAEKIADPDLQHAFLTRIAENARTLALAAELRVG